MILPLSPDKKHYIVHNEEYVRMTHALSYLPKPWLKTWRDKVGEEEASRILETTAYDGSMIHLVTEHRDTGNKWAHNHLLKSKPWLFMYDMAWMVWKKGCIQQFFMIEQTLYSDEWRVAGTIDRLGMFIGDDCSTIVDIKSTKSLSASMGVQLYGYLTMVKETIKREKLDIPVPERMGICHMPGPRGGDEENGRVFDQVKWKEYEVEEYKEAFQECMETFHALTT